MRSTRLGIAALGVALAAAVLTPAATADTINIGTGFQNEGIGFFNGSITYTGGLGTGTLVIQLTNLVTNNGDYTSIGKITDVYFNFATADSGFSVGLDSVSGSGDDSEWLLLGGSSGSLASLSPPTQFGDYMGGAGLTNGNPNRGINAGDTGTFTFTITASDAESLTAKSFLSGGLYNGAPDNVNDFAVRFQGWDLADGVDPDTPTSDKVGASQIVVPVPAPVVLAGLGLLGVVGMRIRRRTA